MKHSPDCSLRRSYIYLGVGRVSFVALMAFASAPAFAQAQSNSTSPPETVAPAAVNPDDIVVTARRRNENLQDVPLSVSAFGPAQLQAQGITTVKDLQSLVPAVQYSDRGTLQTEFTIRGIGGDSRNIGIESGVGMYIDGVYVARTSGYNSDLANIAQVEVLRGPQGTLYGKNTIGGVINIITKKPGDTLEGFAYASYGNYNAIKTQAAVSGPLTSNLFAGITVATTNRDGYLYNLYNGQKLNNEDRRGVRAQLRWLATDQLEFDLSIDDTRDRQNYVLNQMGSASGAAAPYYTGNRFLVNTDQRNSANRDTWGSNLTADYKLDSGITLSSITAYRKISVLVYSDIDQTPLDLFHSGPFTDRSEMVTQELRIVSPSSGSFRYVGGLYYFYQDATGVRNVYINGLLAAGAINDAAAITNSYAAYANADYDLTSKLTFTGGMRYTIERKTGRFYQARPNLNYNFPNLYRRDENLSWTGSLRYEFNPFLTSYVTISKGYKAGGFNLDTVSASNLVASDLVFAPESVVNYEAGIKGHTANNALRFSAAIFDLEYTNKQVSQFVATGATSVPSIQITNAGQARIRGVEADLTLKPVAGFTLFANGSYLDAKYLRFDGAASVGGALVSYAGNRIERTPNWTGAATAEYRFPIRNGAFVTSGTVTYTGDTNLQPDNLPRNFQPGYALLSSRIGISLQNGLDVFLWGRNLTQKTYRTFARVFANLDQAVYGEPRTYGVDVRFRF